MSQNFDEKSIFGQLWGYALGVVSSAEDDLKKVFSRFQDATDWTQDEAARQFRSFSSRISAQRMEFDKKLVELVHSTYEKMNLPRREQLTRISERLDALEARLKELSR